MKRALILGSNGFIGSSLAKVLAARADTTVTGFARGADRSGVLDAFVSCDLSDRQGLAQALAGQEVVFHLISETIPATSWNDPGGEVVMNLIPTIAMIEESARAGIRRIAFASSGGTVYGAGEAEATELTATKPFSPYGIVKRSIESFLEYASVRHGIGYDIYRISNVYGEGQDTGSGLGFINTALEAVVAGKPIVVYGDGEVIRDYIHVKDVARLMASTMDRIGSPPATFNISSNRPLSLNQIIDMIRNITARDIAVEYIRGRAADNPVVRIDGSRILAETGITDLTPLEDGIRTTYEYLMERASYVKAGV
jgi:UDP-glucose 4-epimerase